MSGAECVSNLLLVILLFSGLASYFAELIQLSYIPTLHSFSLPKYLTWDVLGSLLEMQRSEVYT